MRNLWTKLAACAAALCMSLIGFGLPVCAESDKERLFRENNGDISAEITRIECCGSMNAQYVEAGTALKDLHFALSVWFEGEVDSSGYYEVLPEEIIGYDPSEGVKKLTIAVTVQGKPYEFQRDVIVLSPEEYQAHQDVHWLIYRYYMHVMTTGDRWKSWTAGQFNYVGQITPENADTLFAHAYFTEYSANGSDFWDTYHNDETNTFIIPRADIEKMFSKAFTGSPKGLTASSLYHAETDTFEYGLQGYGGGGPPDYSYEKSLDSNGNTVIRYTPQDFDICAHCNNPTEVCYHNIELVLAPDGRMVSIKLMPREIRLETSPLTTYHVGEPFDVKNASIRVIYDDKRSEVVRLTADMVSGYDPAKTGKQALTVTYGGQSIPLEVTVAGEAAPVTAEDKNTGIQLETDGGVVPPGTVIQAKPVTEGGNFTIINDALAQTSHKWVAYDISLLSDNVEIQPNGKVKITMPVPKGLNKNKMALFHVAEDGTLTQIPFTLDKNKKNLIFETDHFSLYAVAETSGSPATGDGGQGVLPWAAGLFLAAGSTVLLLRKRQPAR